MIKWVSVADATQLIGISERSLRYRISKGTIESKLENGKRLVCVEFDDTSHENPHATLHENTHEILHEKDGRIADLQSQVADLQEQLARRDEQIDHFQQIVAMSQKNIAALTEQLSDSRQLIEDMRQRKTVWQRLKAVFVTSTG